MNETGPGRPSDYTPDITDAICLRLAEGESLRQICDDAGMPGRTTVFRWLEKHEEFRDQYARAREVQAECWADEILEIADDGTNDFVKRENKDGSTYETVNSEHINRSRLRVDTRKWLMSKLAPKKYGEKVDLTHAGPGGGPIETKDVSEYTDLEVARRVALLLTKGTSKD